MALDLWSVFGYWESSGFFDIFLPFILVFCLVFAILEKVKVFGDNKRGIHGVVALALALLVANNIYIREILQRFLPNVAFFLVLILAFVMLLSTLMGEEGGKFLQGGRGMTIFAVIIALAFVIWSLVADDVAGVYNAPYYLDWLFIVSEQAQATIFMVAVFVVLLLFMLWPKKPTSTTPLPGFPGGGTN